MKEKYVVRVGTRQEDAQPRYAEFAGDNLHGPFDYDEALAFQNELKTIWSEVPAEAFVYGTPFAELEPVRANAEHWSLERVARNWYMVAE
jgi:hypothetical protein